MDWWLILGFIMVYILRFCTVSKNPGEHRTVFSLKGMNINIFTEVKDITIAG